MGLRVYLVVSEVMESYGNGYSDPPEPPDWGCIADIVVAATAHKARWLAWKNDKASRSLTPADMPNFRCWRLGVGEGAPRVMDRTEAEPWWNLTTEAMEGPPSRPMMFKVASLGRA